MVLQNYSPVTINATYDLSIWIYREQNVSDSHSNNILSAFSVLVCTPALAQLPGPHPTEPSRLLGRGWELSGLPRALNDSTILLLLLYN